MDAFKVVNFYYAFRVLKIFAYLTKIRLILMNSKCTLHSFEVEIFFHFFVNSFQVENFGKYQFQIILMLSVSRKTLKHTTKS